MRFTIIFIVFLLFYVVCKLEVLDRLQFSDSEKTWQIPSSSKLVVFSPNGEMLATVSGQKTTWRTSGCVAVGASSTVEVRQSFSGEAIQVFNFPSAFSAVFSSDNKLIAAGDYEGNINIWRIQDGQLVRSFKGKKYLVFRGKKYFSLRTNFLAFTPDDQNLVSMVITSSSSALESPASVNVWNLNSDDILYSFSGKYSCIDISPNGQLLALVNHDNQLAFYQLSSGILLRHIETNAIGYSCSKLEFSPNGQQIAFVASDRTNIAGEKINIYDVEEGTLQHLLTTYVKSVESFHLGLLAAETINDFTFSRSGDYIAASSYANKAGLFFKRPLSSHGRIRIWQIKQNGAMWLESWQWTLQGHKQRTNALSFSPDGKLASVGMDNTIRIWQVPPRNFIWLWFLGAGGLAIFIYWRKLTQGA